MAWTVSKYVTTDDGLLFEFHGDRVDQQGRPLQVACAFIPSSDPVVTSPKDPDPAVIAAASQKALAQVRASVGDGTLDPVAPKLGARLAARLTPTKPSHAAAGVAVATGAAEGIHALVAALL